MIPMMEDPRDGAGAGADPRDGAGAGAAALRRLQVLVPHLTAGSIRADANQIVRELPVGQRGGPAIIIGGAVLDIQAGADRLIA